MSDHPRSESIDVPPSRVRLLGDFILVLPKPEETYKNLIIIPPAHQKKDGGLLVGEVVKCGPGDRMMKRICRRCGESKDNPISVSPGRCKCGSCGWTQGREFRRPVGVFPGDKVLYWRSPANEVVLQGNRYEILHEEQAVVAVLGG